MLLFNKGESFIISVEIGGKQYFLEIDKGTNQIKYPVNNLNNFVISYVCHSNSNITLYLDEKEVEYFICPNKDENGFCKCIHEKKINLPPNIDPKTYLSAKASTKSRIEELEKMNDFLNRIYEEKQSMMERFGEKSDLTFFNVQMQSIKKQIERNKEIIDSLKSEQKEEKEVDKIDIDLISSQTDNLYKSENDNTQDVQKTKKTRKNAN
ncbi:MAG: hypothetical protein QXF12_06055 [Candidatus Aenigmatarchaeota archaeon]